MSVRVIKNIQINQIRMDRFAVQPSTLDLIDYLKNGGLVPPIHVSKEDGFFKIQDGRHRVTAYKLLGKKEILARFAI